MAVPASPVPDDAAPSDLWSGTLAPASVPRPDRDQTAARRIPPARPDFAGRAAAAFVVTLPTEIDVTNSLDACVPLCAAIDDGARVVIADMSPTRFCDISALRMLLVASVIAADRGVQFRVVVPPGAALHTLEMMGLNRVLSIYSSLQDATAEDGH